MPERIQDKFAASKTAFTPGVSKKKGPSLGKRKRSMSYVSLHHHSTYSFLDGFGLPMDHVQRAADLGMRAMALTEHGTISSHPKLEQAANEAGIKPLFGCELYCNGREKSQRKNHLTVLAEDQTGYRNLLRVISWAWSDGFYYEPTVNGQILSKHSEGLVILSGCRGSLLSTSLIGGKNIEPENASFRRGLEVASRFKEAFGDSYYLEVQAFPDLEETCAINQRLERISSRLKIPLVATCDVHYTRGSENEMQKILHAVRPGQNRTIEEQERAWGYDVRLAPPRSDGELLKKLQRTGLSRKASQAALAHTGEIADRCTVTLPKASPLAFPLPKGYKNAQQVWIDWLREGWRFRRIDQKKNAQEYAKRLKYEASIIEEKEYIDYFLIVSDMCKFTKDSGIVMGPARGSAAASLVCYLLRITEVDPLLFSDLVFERFIDLTRKDLPDIDLDFDDARRFEVFDYLSNKYGRDKVGQLGTFTTYKSKNSLDDVARVYRIPKWEVEAVKELLIERSSGDLRASATIEDTVDMFEEAKAVFERNPDLYAATRLEGMVKGMGKHAAGAIVSSTPLTETCAVYGDVISVDKYDAEYLNLLKMDNLGLSTIGMLAEALNMMGKGVNDLYQIPLDDPITLEGFRENDVVAIFQFDGRAMRLVNNALKPDNFYEVCVVTALARPGPLHNNAMSDYVDIKHGDTEPEFLHPIFDEIVANTQHQVIYQEQILRIVREVGRFDWTAASYIRRIISRKYGDQEFNRQWARFWKGAKKNGLSQDLAKRIWGYCITAGSYAFNAAHSVSYGMLAWWCMWLKKHHPLVFYISALRRLPTGDKGAKHLEIMRDAVRHGFKVLPPDPDKSDVTWKPLGKRALRAGFDQIPGIGEKQGTAIVEARADLKHRMAWPDLLDVKGIGPKTLENILSWVNQDDPLGVQILEKTMRRVVKGIETGKIRGRNGRRLPRPTHKTADVPFGRGEDTEVTWIGTIVQRHLRDLFEVNMAKTGEPLKPDEVRDPDLREWVIMYGTDGDDILSMRIDRWRYPKFKELVWSMKMGRDLILVNGIKKGWAPQRIVDIKQMVVIDTE